MPPLSSARLNRPAVKQPAISALSRWCVRRCLSLFGRPVRVLGSERLPESAAILRICHQARFADAVVLTAASATPVTLVLDRAGLSGLEIFAASMLGMICCRNEASHWHAALRTSTEALLSGGLLAAFEETGTEASDPETQATALRLAEEAWTGAFPDLAPVVLPVHRFRPPGRGQEMLIHIGAPLAPLENEAGGTAPEATSPAHERLESVFSMDRLILDRSLRDFEQALRDRLQEEWARSPFRRQPVDGFRMSPGAVQTLQSLNRAEPEIVVELRQMMEDEREYRRRCSLAELRAQQGRNQLSAISRSLTWTETLIGFPVALYGAVNHVVVGLLLAGLHVVSGKGAQLGTWMIRAFILVFCYTLQIVLVDHLLGRAAAGYYAVTLPVSGSYLWRYVWLLRQRTYVLLLGARAATLRNRADRNRKRLLARLGSILDRGVSRPHAAA